MTASSQAHCPAEHAERLWPAAWVWVTCLLVAASAGLIVLGVLGVGVAIVVAVVAMAAAAAALAATSVVVAVGGGELRAGRAHVPVSVIGRVRALDPAAMSALRGREADTRAYLCQRGWIARGVLVEITDPHDPVPYWLVSSRTPQRLVAALESARGEPQSVRPEHRDQS